MEEEYVCQLAVRDLISKGLINAAHDCADGGLFITLLEMSMPRELGFDIVSDSEVREDAFLFGEAQGRIVVTVDDAHEDDFLDYLLDTKVPVTLLGHVTQGRMTMDDEIQFGFSKEAKTRFNNALGDLLK
jgi:phosphoribosylformylglycinamidine synthase